MYDAKALLAGDENALADAIESLSPELYRYAVGILPGFYMEDGYAE